VRERSQHRINSNWEEYTTLSVHGCFTTAKDGDMKPLLLILLFAMGWPCFANVLVAHPIDTIVVEKKKHLMTVFHKEKTIKT